VQPGPQPSTAELQQQVASLSAALAKVRQEAGQLRQQLRQQELSHQQELASVGGEAPCLHCMPCRVSLRHRPRPIANPPPSGSPHTSPS
jgi:hypothetical protein